MGKCLEFRCSIIKEDMTRRDDIEVESKNNAYFEVL
jgi:hypothetical protein